MVDETAVRKIRDAGVVGAGGAGFPTHVKYGSEAELVIANGAECEPLLECDYHLMLHKADEVLAGLRAAMAVVCAKRGVVAVKDKHPDLIAHLRTKLAGARDVQLHVLPDLYPMGDEQVMVQQVTGRLVPPGGLPLAVGCVVSNVTTLYNVHRALEQEAPVIRRSVTVTGLVKHPFTRDVAIGTRVGDLIKAAGGLSDETAVLIAGGPMTGRLVGSMDDPITKTVGGILALPAESYLVLEKRMSIETIRLQSKAACFQCRDCTRVCPRWQLGSPLQPHLIMRAANYELEEAKAVLETAHYCCDCGLCSVMGCQTMKLSPRMICNDLKRKVPRPAVWTGPVKVPEVPLDDQRVPTSRITMRHQLAGFGHTGFESEPFVPDVVVIPLKQGIGCAARPLVKVGQHVAEGELIGGLPDKGLGATVHASRAGTVRAVSEQAVTITS